MPTTPIPRPRFALPAAAAVLLSTSLLAACGGGGPPADAAAGGQRRGRASKPITEWDGFDGRIAAIESVEIRPRVSGYLAGVHFRDGSEVAKGALLFTVDDREYRAALASAQANTARAATPGLGRAHRVRAFREAEGRARRLRGGTRDAARRAAAGRGRPEGREAQEQQAALNIEFTRIRAPIAGYVSAARCGPATSCRRARRC
jgi:membrane fusion protein, multidrug efflux system